MQILILDDDKSYGALVASACRKLGHRARVSPSAAATVELLQQESADVLLLDLEMPPRTGTEIALWLRAQGYQLPIAFCTGTCQDSALIASAHAMAEVLPKVWTHADLKGILDGLEVECREQKRQSRAMGAQSESGSMRFAVGTGPGARTGFESVPTEDLPAPSAGDTIRSEGFARELAAELATLDDAPALASEFAVDAATVDEPGLPVPGAQPGVAPRPPRPALARVPIYCSTWQLVRQICEDVHRGLRTISVHAEQELHIEEDVLVAVALPDEMVVSLRGRVQGLSPATGQARSIYSIELIDVGPQEIGYLLALCDEHAPPADGGFAHAGETWNDAPDDFPPAAMPAAAIPATRDYVDLDLGDFEGEPRISWDTKDKR